ncbi:MlaD family protein [Pseudofulvibacter geojedonensis]|uniref:MlaD family protein n=1 Tax=Pseudofulvibacter geojedonensis TaxID=1123758 RepID=A0ABW3I345_9FLAO
MKLSREIKTAILMLAAIFLFIFGFSYLKGKNLFGNEQLYYTTFEYNALAKGAIVTLKGNPIGKVEQIKYDFEKNKTVVAFSVSESFQFSKNSLVKMYETGLMSGNGLAIIPAKEGERAVPGDFLKSQIQKGLVTSLKENFSGLSTGLDVTLKSADTLLHNLNALVEDDSEKGLKNAIAELNKTMKSFKNLSYSLNGVLTMEESKLNKMIISFTNTGEKFGKLVDSLEQANLGATVANLDKTLTNLNRVLEGINAGEGTMGKLMKDEKLYNNFEAASKELEELLRDIKLHPKRYFRILSKKEIPYEQEKN